MTVVLFCLAALILWLAYRLVDDYLRRSMVSFAHAEKARAMAQQEAVEMLETGVPQSVARLIVQLSALAGCGCFVRGMLMSHYLPKAVPSRGAKKGPWDVAFSDLDKLDADIRRKFDKYVSYLVLYDGYRNPLQGWLFQRALRSLAKPEPRYDLRMERQLAAYSVVSRRAASRHALPDRLLEVA